MLAPQVRLAPRHTHQHKLLDMQHTCTLTYMAMRYALCTHAHNRVARKETFRKIRCSRTITRRVLTRHTEHARANLVASARTHGCRQQAEKGIVHTHGQLQPRSILSRSILSLCLHHSQAFRIRTNSDTDTLDAADPSNVFARVRAPLKHGRANVRST